MIKLFRSTLQERSNYSRESRLARNRQVSKIHERLARDAHKAQDDDKGRRMDALKVSLAPPPPFSPLPPLPVAFILLVMTSSWAALQIPYGQLCKFLMGSSRHDASIFLITGFGKCRGRRTHWLWDLMSQLCAHTLHCVGT